MLGIASSAKDTRCPTHRGVGKQTTPQKTMNLLLASIGLGALIFLVVVGIHRIAMWMQGRENNQLKGK